MYYFNESVLAQLREHGVSLSKQEQVAYLAKCIQVEKISRGIKTQKEPAAYRQYSLWHLPSNDKNINAEHWLILPGDSNWITKGNKTFTKRAINILTGEPLFLKIRRPLDKPFENHNMMLSSREYRNNHRLEIPVQHCERKILHGYKAYLFQPDVGRDNLFDIVDGWKLSVDLTLKLLVAAGESLQKIHDKGFIHADFKLENIVFNEKTNKITIIDHEHLLSIAEGAKGIYKHQGTIQYQHRDWIKHARQQLLLNSPVIYTIKNDVYGYIISVVSVLLDLDKRIETANQKSAVMSAQAKFREWAHMPFGQLPDLRTVIDKVHGLQKQLVEMKVSTRPRGPL